MVAEVIINSTAKKLNRTFDYNIPKELEDLIVIGSKVLVPFGTFKHLEEAHVVGIKNSSEFKIKDIVKVETGLTNKQINLKKHIEDIEFDIESGKLKSEKQIRILNFVKNNEGYTIPDIEAITDCSRAIINTLIKNQYLELIETKIERNPLNNKEIENTKNLELNNG